MAKTQNPISSNYYRMLQERNNAFKVICLKAQEINLKQVFFNFKMQLGAPEKSLMALARELSENGIIGTINEETWILDNSNIEPWKSRRQGEKYLEDLKEDIHGKAPPIQRQENTDPHDGIDQLAE